MRVNHNIQSSREKFWFDSSRNEEVCTKNTTREELWGACLLRRS